MSVLEIIRALRLERGWTEYQLAEKSGLTQSTISSWYRKQMQPTIASLEHICMAFDMTISQFFAFGSSEKSNNLFLTEKELEFFREYSHLSEKQKKALFDLVKTMGVIHDGNS